MFNRFVTPPWTKQHSFAYSDWRSLSPDILKRIKHGLARFKSPNPQVSIVIPVWNEEKNLIRTLSSLSALDLSVSAELIIVNNNSTDDTANILSYFDVETIFEARQGIAHARLAGLRASRGEYQLCGDGDSIYPPGWITHMTSPIRKKTDIACVYANYSFLPDGSTPRFQLACYEMFAEILFEVRRLKREFLNVRGANFGFRTHDGLSVRGFEMSVTRVFDNDERSENHVIYGEDGRMGRKLSEIGKLKLVRSRHARIWTSSRRLHKDGTLSKAFAKRLVSEFMKLFEYLFASKKIKQTTDHLPARNP